MNDKKLGSLKFAAESLYADHIRHYHNWDHVCNVVNSLKKLYIFEPPVAVVVAGMWHDAVYYPGARNGVNENASAAALTYHWTKLNVNLEFSILHEATRMIENTTVEHHLARSALDPNTNQAYLMDADLSELATDYDTFVESQKNILRENNLDVTKYSIQRSCNFLATFLTVRPFIYHTVKGQELFEDIAKENITRFIEENRINQDDRNI